MKKLLVTAALGTIVFLSAGCSPIFHLLGPSPAPLREYTLEGDGKDKILLIEVSGIRDILTKSLGSGNVFNRAMACFKALQDLYNPEVVASRREMTVKDLLGREVVDPYVDVEKSDDEADDAEDFERALAGGVDYEVDDEDDKD